MSASGRGNPGQARGRGRGRGRGWGQGDTVLRGGPPQSGGANRGHGSPAFHGDGRNRFGGQGSSAGPNRGSQFPRGGRGGFHMSGSIFMQDQPATIDARLANGSDKAIVANFDTSKAGAGDLPLRPDFGTKGKEITLRTNYFPVHMEGTMYQYTAVVTHTTSPFGKEDSRRIKRRVFQLAENTTDWKQAGMSDRVAHDGAGKLVAASLLPQPLAIHIAYYEEEESGPPAQGEKEYTLTLSFDGEVDQDVLKASLAGNPVDSKALSKVLSALNLVLTTHPSQTGVKIGRNDDDKKNPDQRVFFNSPNPVPLGGGLEARQGFYLSVRPGHQQLMANVNTCHAPFYTPQNFVDAMEEYRKFVAGGMSGFGAQVRVITTHTKCIVTIRGLSKKSAREYKITVEQFFKLKYDLELKRPELPLLDAGNNNFLPPEVCDILPDQSFRGELSDRKHAQRMLDVACKPPNVNAKEIVGRGLDLLGFQNPGPVLDAFGVSVDPNMAVVPGRILNKPGLAYSRNTTVTIDNRASWNLAKVKFAVGARLDKWAILVIKDGNNTDFNGTGDPELHKFADGFRGMCNKSGMDVPRNPAYAEVQLPPKADPFRDAAIRAIEGVLRNLMNKVHLTCEDSAIYDGLESLCDLQLDLATICVQSAKVRPAKPQYLANVALKVNMKMGGINHKLDAKSGEWLRSAPTMVFGIDVTHPSPGSVKGTPSIVAVVASVDEHYAQYPATLAIRKSKVEMIKRDGDNVLRDMFISRFELYESRNNGSLPERVIIYRDGVSESQYAQLRQYELPQMQMAFTKFDRREAPYKPRLTIVVCGKRHHTRFYPTEEGNAAMDGNPLPGTVVDRGVTPAYEFDFFLQAHGGLKGTTRPTHYFVVHDENSFKADELQGVTNDLSYLFARATKAVSLVSPAYWADVACERGRCYLRKLLRGQVGGASVGGGRGNNRNDKGSQEDKVFEQAKKIWNNGVSGAKLKDTMYYL
ncbi:Piwi domain-containing protein [Melanogaster broomeanus]|nr:Piwi domain-containing protein [Melanogaster broomeanus]